MRLIDADLLEDYIRGNIPLNLQEKFILAVEDQPTTYNVGRAIREVEEVPICNCCKVIEEVIGIIKKGGIQDE